MSNGTGDGRTDGQLLENYVSRREVAALIDLVRRHAPIIWGVCRHVLGNYHDAEDASQASFLVLVRKAASIAPREMVGNWLYGVAHQTAMKARATTAKRRAREKQVMQMPEPAVTEQDLRNDLQPLLDQELSRLPDKYRVAIVLCDLEGKTIKEAARQLGVPDGTLAALLARGRGMLAKRLARRGLAVFGGALGAALSRGVASACVAPSVVSCTIETASLFAAGQAASGLIPVKVATLTAGVLKTMLLTKLKIATAVLLVVGVLAGVSAFSLLAVGRPGYALAQGPQDKGTKDAPQPKPCVAKELKLDAKQIDALWKLHAELSEHAEDNVRPLEDILALHKKLPQILKPSQIKGFMQLGAQTTTTGGYPSIGGMSYPEIQQALKLTEGQKKDIKSLNREARRVEQGGFGEGRYRCSGSAGTLDQDPQGGLGEGHAVAGQGPKTSLGPYGRRALHVHPGPLRTDRQGRVSEGGGPAEWLALGQRCCRTAGTSASAVRSRRWFGLNAVTATPTRGRQDLRPLRTARLPVNASRRPTDTQADARPGFQEPADGRLNRTRDLRMWDLRWQRPQRIPRQPVRIRTRQRKPACWLRRLCRRRTPQSETPG